MTAAEMRRVSFHDSTYVLGCQFPIVILALDVATIAPALGYVTDMLTRAMIFVHCVVNVTLSPLLIHGKPSFSTTRCKVDHVTPLLNKLTSETESEGPVFVLDMEKRISRPIRANLESKGRFDWFELQEEYDDMFERTKGALLLVEVTKPGIACIKSLKTYAPILELVIMRDNDGDGSRDYDKDYRKPIIQFFKSYRAAETH